MVTVKGYLTDKILRKGYITLKKSENPYFSNTHVRTAAATCFIGLWRPCNYLRFKMQWVLLQAFVFLFRGLRSVQLFCESSLKQKHRRHLVEEVNWNLCAKLAWHDFVFTICWTSTSSAYSDLSDILTAPLHFTRLADYIVSNVGNQIAAFFGDLLFWLSKSSFVETARGFCLAHALREEANSLRGETSVESERCNEQIR